MYILKWKKNAAYAYKKPVGMHCSVFSDLCKLTYRFIFLFVFSKLSYAMSHYG